MCCVADESGGESDDAGGGNSTSSSYSSLSDLVTDIQNSEISGDTPGESPTTRHDPVVSSDLGVT